MRGRHGIRPAYADPELGWPSRPGRPRSAGFSRRPRCPAAVVAPIPPPLPQRPSEEGRAMLAHFGSTAVRASAPDEILGLLRAMPPPAVMAPPTPPPRAARDP